MGLDVGRIDRARSVHAGRSRQGVEYAGPYPLPAPAIEAIVDRRVGPVDLRAIAPARPTAQHMDDAADHPTIIDAMGSLTASGQQRLDPLPLRIAQPINALPHQRLHRPWRLESQYRPVGNPY